MVHFCDFLTIVREYLVAIFVNCFVTCWKGVLHKFDGYFQFYFINIHFSILTFSGYFNSIFKKLRPILKSTDIQDGESKMAENVEICGVILAFSDLMIGKWLLLNWVNTSCRDRTLETETSICFVTTFWPIYQQKGISLFCSFQKHREMASWNILKDQLLVLSIK